MSAAISMLDGWVQATDIGGCGLCTGFGMIWRSGIVIRSLSQLKDSSRPHLGEHPERFQPLGTSQVGVDIEGGQLSLRDGPAPAELNPSIGKDVEYGDPLRHPDGMVDRKGKQHDGMPEPDLFCLGGEIAEEHLWRGAERETVKEVVLGKPRRPETELVGELDLFEGFPINAIDSLRAVVIGFKLVNEAEFHFSSSFVLLGCSCACGGHTNSTTWR